MEEAISCASARGEDRRKMNLPDLKDFEQIPTEQIPAVLLHLSAIQTALTVRLIASPSGAPSPADDHLLDIEEAAERLGITKDWLYRRSAKLPFTVRMGNRLRFSSNGIDRYIQQRKGRA